MTSKYLKPPPPLSPATIVAKKNSETMERELIFGCVKSIFFYRQARNVLCPFDQAKGRYREDFTVNRYNILYRAVDSFWRRFDERPLEKDICIPPHLLSPYLIDWCNKNTISVADAEQLVKEIHEEIPLADAITFESSSALLNSEGFRVWMEDRLTEYAADAINTQKSIGILTFDSLEKAVNDLRAGLAGLGRDAPKPLGELAAVAEDDASVLIGPHRFLSRGGLMELVGLTHIGKSTFGLQMVIRFSLGLEFFGMKPNGPLNTLILQSENDDGEMAEFRDGIFNGLELTGGDRALAGKMIQVQTCLGTSGAEFASRVVAPSLAKLRPDLVLIDPALAFLGGDSKEQADVGKFLRMGLLPLLKQYDCGCILVHHTNKPATGKDPSSGNWRDQAYSGSGSSEWANVARAVMTLKSTDMHGIFELSVPKRGDRLEWKNEDGSRRMSRFIRHSREPGKICWYDANQEELDQAQSESVQEEIAAIDDKVYQAITAYDGGIAKNALAETMRQNKVPSRKLDESLNRLVKNGSISKQEAPRTGVRPEIRYLATGTLVHRNGNGRLQTLISPG